MTGQSRTPHYCLQCDDGTVMELCVKNVTVKEGDFSREVPGVAGWHCPKCGEIEFIERDSSERHMAALREVYEKAHAGEGRSIRSLRKRLGLTQAEAGQLFGGGVNAFSRYEQGKARPHHSTEILLNLLAKRPELLTDVRAMAKTV